MSNPRKINNECICLSMYTRFGKNANLYQHSVKLRSRIVHFHRSAASFNRHRKGLKKFSASPHHPAHKKTIILNFTKMYFSKSPFQTLLNRSTSECILLSLYLCPSLVDNISCELCFGSRATKHVRRVPFVVVVFSFSPTMLKNNSNSNVYV